METSYGNDDDDGAAPGDKLIPEWSIGADDQVLLAGLAVVGILALLLGWNAWRGDAGGDGGEPFAPAVEQASADGSPPAEEVVAIVTTTSQPTTTSEPTTTTEAVTTTEAAAQTTTTPTGPVVGDVQAAVDPFPGAITGSADGTIAVLNGFVANDAESREAEAAAGAVEGITAVENNLVVLEPAVEAALTDAGVTGATAVGRGTEISVSGTIGNEDDRQPALDAAAAVDGVTAVADDRLNLSVTADLNALPQVQFDYNSSEILPASFGDLDAAAELLAGVGDISVDIQGYTDVQGDQASNLELSQERAEAVRTYLINAGVDPEIVSATGFGETAQFGTDPGSNRLVRFEQIDG